MSVEVRGIAVDIEDSHATLDVEQVRCWHNDADTDTKLRSPESDVPQTIAVD